LEILKETISIFNNIVSEPDRAEYGDFQTNENLAKKVTLFIESKTVNPQIIIEPTCGKGNFIIASLSTFPSIEYVFGIEIYKPYVWETKFNLIEFFLNNPQGKKPQISIIHCDVFDYDFKSLAKQYSEKELLVIGNPPWVTNSKLGSLNSSNLPKKSNFKNHSGLDAMTWKGNFDIAEYITLKMLDFFQNTKGNLLLLVKNSVIKNIVLDQAKNKYLISNIEKHCIDSKKEFNVSVEASLLYCKLKSNSENFCTEFNFYKNHIPTLKFGWLDDKFVSNIDTYSHTKNIDGESPFVWRQGLKHDCSSIMELVKVNGHFLNGLNEEIQLEDGLVYGLLKSSDLKNTVINQTRKFTIIHNTATLRFQAFKIMVAISKKYPDLSNEIILLTDPYYIDNLSYVVRKSVFTLMTDTKPKLIKTIYQEDMNLEFTLKNSHKNDCLSYITSHQEDFPELIELSISDKQPYSWRAAWLLSSCMDNNDQRVKRYLQKILDILPARENSQQWSLLKVLQRIEIEPEYEGQLFDTCTIIWKNINNKPFTRFQAFKIMVAILKKYPDLSNEIKLLTDPYYTDNLSDNSRKSVFKLMDKFFS